MAVNWHPGALFLKDGLPPRRPVDRRVFLRRCAFGLASLSLMIAVGFLGWHVARIAAPAVVRLQIELTDRTSEAPPLPHLPTSPFAR